MGKKTGWTVSDLVQIPEIEYPTVQSLMLDDVLQELENLDEEVQSQHSYDIIPDMIDLAFAGGEEAILFLEKRFSIYVKDQFWSEQMFMDNMVSMMQHTNRMDFNLAETYRWLAWLMHAAEIKRGSVEGLASKITTPLTERLMEPRKSLMEEYDKVSSIRSMMLIDQVMLYLTQHGGKDITSQLDLTLAGPFPTAHGGSCDVFKLPNPSDGTLLALKVRRVLTSEVVKDLKDAARELHTWSKCDHINVVKLLGFVNFRERIAIVCPWMEHGHLRNYLSLNVKADRYQLSTQICEGLVYLHSQGIVHGDLKGDNVLISDTGVAGLTDFGNATLKDRTLRFTGTAENVGLSLRWAAPEILEGRVKPNVKADVYALGMTIWEAFTGQVPHGNIPDVRIYHHIVTEKRLPTRPIVTIPQPRVSETNSAQSSRNAQGSHPPLSENYYSNQLWDLVVSCCAYDAGGRPLADQVLKELKTIRPKEWTPVDGERDPFVLAEYVYSTRRLMRTPTGSGFR